MSRLTRATVSGMKPIDTPQALDGAARDEEEVRRVSAQVASQLEQRGVHVHDDDAPAERADILSVVERFERAVSARGGDSFVNSPLSSDPERRDYVLPRRGADQNARDYIARVQAAAEALGIPPE